MAILAKLDFQRFGLFMHDYGGPVGFRLVENSEALEWLIVQNSNAYEVGFSDAWLGLRALWKERSEETEAPLRALRRARRSRRSICTGRIARSS